MISDRSCSQNRGTSTLRLVIGGYIFYLVFLLAALTTTVAEAPDAVSEAPNAVSDSKEVVPEASNHTEHERDIREPVSTEQERATLEGSFIRKTIEYCVIP